MAPYQNMTRTASNGNSSLTLDELFQLKRAEAPSADFWPKFDQTLRRRSLQALVNTSRQQRKHLWRGWGLGTSLAALLALMVPVGLLFLEGIPGVTGTQASKPSQSDETAAVFAGHGLIRTESIQPVDTPFPSLVEWASASDFRFVIETFESGSDPRAPVTQSDTHLQLPAEQRDRFVSDVITVSDSLTRPGRGASFF